jgi:hypothetical protein
VLRSNRHEKVVGVFVPFFIAPFTHLKNNPDKFSKAGFGFPFPSKVIKE